MPFPKTGAARIAQVDDLLGMPPIDKFPFGRSEYDFIIIKDTEMLLKSQPSSGTALNIDRHKRQGRDWEHLISKGYTLVPTKFTLLLCKNQLDGVNYFERYWKSVHPILMPISVINRENAIDLYHPILSAEGITKLVVEKRPTPKYVKDQMWEVEVEGYDIRFAKPADDKKNVNKPVSFANQNNGIASGVAVVSSPNPFTNEVTLYNSMTGEVITEDATNQSLNETGVITPAYTMVGAK